MVTTDDICDYVIVKTNEAGVSLNVLKLQKLMYYVQAWHLAFFDRPLFNGGFQAWVHGPVNRELYNRFKESKSLYSPVLLSDIRNGFNVWSVATEAASHTSNVLESYARFSDSQLEEMTHREEPWIRARGLCAPNERCETLLDDALIASFYRSRLA